MCTAADPRGPAAALPQLQPRPLQRTATQPTVKDIPSSSAAPVLSKYLADGKLLEFRVNDTRLLGVVVRPDTDNQYRVAAVDGAEYSVLPTQIVVVLPGKDYTVEDARQIQAEADAVAPGALQRLWEEMHEEAVAESGGAPLGSDPASHHDIVALCRRLWGKTEPGSLYATHSLLCDDQVYFFRLKTRPPTFHVRERAEVERLQRQQALAAEQAEQRSALLGALQAAADADAKPAREAWLSGPHRDAVQHIVSFSKGETEAPHGSALYALLDMGLEVSTSGAAHLLKLIGFWPRQLPNSVLRGEVVVGFPDYVQSMAERVAAASEAPDDMAALRQDHTGLLALAVDDELTSEVDDAVSIEVLPEGGWRVLVHVADPAAYVSSGDPLDLEAMQRGRTLYLPWTKVTMFPTPLSEGLFSLVGDSPRRTLTFVAKVDATGRLLDCSVHPAVTRCAAVTYADADRIMTDAAADTALGEATVSLINEMQRVSQARLAYRTRNGAVTIPNIESSVRVANIDSDSPDIKVGTIAMSESPSRQAVMEMMVLAGEVAAKWAGQRGVPLLFRSQPAPVAPTQQQLERVAHSPFATGYLWRTRMLKSASNASQPNKHNALGINGYCQVTSPIRRYTDLLCHYQIKAALLGRTPPFTVTSLEAAGRRIDDMTRRHRSLEQEANQHFIAMHLAQYPKSVFQAIVLGTNKDGSSQILIPDLGIERGVQLQGPAAPGSTKALRPIVNVLSGTVSWAEAD